ncbi:MAG: AI-2E family transporter [Acidobacteria bacterium]|nr:AI-2E family transporter [Acidobacteriota bacterium]
MERYSYARIAFVAVLLVVVYYVFRILQPFLVALIWAAILATVFHPLFDSLVRRLKRRELAGALACLLITVAIILPVIVLLILLAGESVDAYHYVQERLKTGNIPSLESLSQSAAYEWLRAKLLALGLPEPDLRSIAVNAVQTISQFLVRHSSSVFSGFAAFVFNFVVMLVGTYYLFLSGPALMAELRRLSPLRREHEDQIIAKFTEITRATFEGNLMTALLQGTAGGLVFLGFGLPSPLLWGAVMTFLSLVPLVGTALVWGPVVIYYLLTGMWMRGLLLFFLCAVVVGSIDNFVKPLLIRRRAQIPTIWIFVGVMGGIGTFGFLGFFLGPLMIAVLFTLIEIYKVEFRSELGEKQST